MNKWPYFFNFDEIFRCYESAIHWDLMRLWQDHAVITTI